MGLEYKQGLLCPEEQTLLNPTPTYIYIYSKCQCIKPVGSVHFNDKAIGLHNKIPLKQKQIIKHTNKQRKTSLALVLNFIANNES